MTVFLRIGFFVVWITSVLYANAQYPRFYGYNSENGLPSNEVYSVVQDDRGFVWIGSDAGLCKFDGVHYSSYKCATQRSKSITGLILSRSGTIYCYNFQAQIFFLENDTLKELKPTITIGSISSISSDNFGNVIFSHDYGVALYNEKTRKWDPMTEVIGYLPKSKMATKTIIGSHLLHPLFVSADGLYELSPSRAKLLFANDFIGRVSPGLLLLEWYQGIPWIFSREEGRILTLENNALNEWDDPKLKDLLKNRKIAHVKVLQDGCLWICTYQGVIRYNGQTRAVELYYPEFSISDCMIDRENNYWFATLQNGLIRVPDIQSKVWNEFIGVAKVTHDEHHVYFGTLSGVIGRLDSISTAVEVFDVGVRADVQSLDYDSTEHAVWFNINNNLWGIRENKVVQRENDVMTIKSRIVVDNTEFAASSHGLFIDGKKVLEVWSRGLQYDAQLKAVWVATNDGLYFFKRQGLEWKNDRQFFKGNQILSLAKADQGGGLFVLDFIGSVYLLDESGAVNRVVELPKDVLPTKIFMHEHKLYVATNRGVWIYYANADDIPFQLLTHISGLISDNVQDIDIWSKRLWVATGSGIQSVPIGTHREEVRARIYLKDFPFLRHVEGEYEFEINFGERLVLKPEVSAYTSNGDFQYYYQINEGTWQRLPATIDDISLSNLPFGNVNIVLKVVDHLGRDSENQIHIRGYVNPPFYERWWFKLGGVLLLFLILALVVKKYISVIRRRERMSVLLANSQLTALKAQMNPHFMYNTLNSIQALILKQDIKNSNLYLSKFSHLMRKVLDVSGRDDISIAEEVEILELYLALEQLRFGEEFSFEIKCDDEIDVHNEYIPPLLLQPFVENALKHGLLHKKGKKRILVSFELMDKKITCRIVDNGVGRKRSTEIRQRQREGHRSFSTQATQRRIDLLNRTRDHRIELSIVDLMANNEAVGTEVVLTIS